MMYLISIVLLLGLFPIASIVIETIYNHQAILLFLIGKWFVFWSGGVRLLLAGARQIFNPTFTAETIFNIKDKTTLLIVKELGFANCSMGLLGVITLFNKDWVVPTAIVTGLYYGLAGVGHLLSTDRNATRTIVMISDFFIFLIFALYLILSLCKNSLI